MVILFTKTTYSISKYKIQVNAVGSLQLVLLKILNPINLSSCMKIVS